MAYCISVLILVYKYQEVDGNFEKVVMYGVYIQYKEKKKKKRKKKV